MFNKAQLAERGKHYFDDPKISRMYATTDGNFFYENDKNYADSHAKSLKTQVIEITKSDLSSKKSTKKEDEPEVEKVEVTIEPTDNGSVASFDELKVEAKKLKIKGWGIMKEETLRKKIAEANGTT